MKYIISGSIDPFFTDGSFASFFTDNNAKKVLVIGDHHTKGIDYAFDKIRDRSPAGTLADLNFVKGTYKTLESDTDLSQFDGLYISGGLMDALFFYFYSLNIYEMIKQFVFDPTKVYVGASAGALLIGKKIFTESEMDAVYLSRFSDESFGFFPDKLIEVHYNEGGNKDILDSRIKDALAQNPELTEAYALESDGCLHFKDFSKFEFETLRGKYNLITR